MTATRTGSEKRRLLLDMDTGIDDAFAIMYLAAHPTTDIIALGSCQGNCSAEKAAINALRVLEVCGLAGVPVATGIETPLAGEREIDPIVHGTDGLADVGLPEPQGSPTGESAVDQMIRLAHEQPGQLDLLAVGSMTNIAYGLERDPDLLTRFRSVTILGACSRPPRDGDPKTEDANIYFDHVAARRMFGAGTPITVMPIDTTAHIFLEEEGAERILHAETPHGRFAAQILPHYMAFHEEWLGRRTPRMHDPSTAAVVADPTLVIDTVERAIDVDAEGDRWRAAGRETQQGGTAHHIITSIDTRRFISDFVRALTTPMGEFAPEAFVPG